LPGLYGPLKWNTVTVYDDPVCGNSDTRLIGAVCLKDSLRPEEIGRFLCIAAKGMQIRAAATVQTMLVFRLLE